MNRRLEDCGNSIDKANSFPYYDDDPNQYTQLVSSFYKLRIGSNEEELTVGWMLPWVVEKMNWIEGFLIDSRTKIVSLAVPDIDGDKPINSIIEEQLVKARESQTFQVLKGWRDELYPLAGLNADIRMERAATALFGIITYGVHLTAYTTINQRLMIWVPRRARTKQTYGGMLDNTVAGGLSAGEDPFDCLVREADEEASLPEDIVRKKTKACGSVSHFHIRDERAGGEVGLLQPEVEYVYDIELPSDIVPRPCDTEVEEFFLWTVDEVERALAEGQFKPNCAVVLVDFFVRHGIITIENEPEYVEIISRIHRKLPFGTVSSRKSS